jgi:rod shape-determining protein MreD
MISFFIWTLLSFLSVALQATLFFGPKPDIVLIVVCFHALKKNTLSSSLFGAVSGLIVDVSHGFIIGPSIVSKFLAGYIVSSIRQRFFGWGYIGYILNTFIIVFMTIIDHIVMFISVVTFIHVPLNVRTIESLLHDTTYTAIVSVILYPFLNWIYPQKTLL